MTRPPWLAGALTKEQNRAAELYFAEVEKAERLKRLSDGTTSAFGDILRRAGRIARATTPQRPCSYAPWLAAFGQVNLAPGVMEGLIRDACRPPWPVNATEVIDFALTVLEEDPMFHGSGYAKRHLVNRLRQQPLSASQIARVDAALRRTVLHGTGLEEFRALCKLAATLRPDGLQDWLEETAKGALLSLFDTGNEESFRFLARLDADKLDRLTAHHWAEKPKWALVATDPDLPLRKMTPRDWDDPAVKTRRNAWRMAAAIRRADGQDQARALRGARRRRSQDSAQ